jgi:thiol-disulfide isomerase/thioredoxin
MVGQVDVGMEYSDRYLQIAERLGDSWLRACAVNDKAMLLVSVRRFQDALGLVPEALALARSIHSPFFEFAALLVRAEALLGLGRLEEALASIDEGLAVKTEAWPMLTAQTSRRGFWVILVLALLGAGLQAVAVRKTQEPQTSVTRTAIGGQGNPAATAPAATPLSFRGVPLDVYGLGWFLLVAVLELASGYRTDDRRVRFRTYLFGIAVLGVAAVAAVAYQTRGGWASQSPFNLIAAACVIGIFTAAASSPHAPVATVRRHLLEDARLVFARPPLWIAVAAMFAVFATRPAPSIAENAIPTGATFEPWYASQPRVAMPASAKGAPVVIIKFIDYECGPCKLAHDELLPLIEEMKEQYPDAIRFVQMDFPLSTECNRFTSQDTHPAACEAAAAVRMASAEGTRDALDSWL